MHQTVTLLLKELKKMITVYLNFPGNAGEAIDYYTKLFDAPAPYVMRVNEMPHDDQQYFPEESRHLVAYANIKTFAGDLMLSDEMPGQQVKPTDAVYLNLSHTDHDLLKKTFDAMAKDGEIVMPLEPVFFNPLYGIVKDKFGFNWMIMADEEQGQ